MNLWRSNGRMAMLDAYKSRCEAHQKIIVSRDVGNCKHISNNVKGETVRQYAVDEDDIISVGEKCDYLVLNDDKRTAYYIELKGSDVEKAKRQVENTERQLARVLNGYRSFFRVIYRTGTHRVTSSSIVRWKESKGKDPLSHEPFVVVKSMFYEEDI